jgi:uncharacterized membrane protein YkvA (DUF1232 family)
MDDVVAQPFSRAEMEAARRQTTREQHPFPEFLDLFRKVFRRIPFAEDMATAYFCATDSATPVRVKAILGGAIAYFVLPLDAVADLLPVIGFADDAAVLATAIAAVTSAILPRHREAARRTLADLKDL